MQATSHMQVRRMILIMTRHDAIDKPGGDVHLLHQFAKELEPEFDVDVIVGVPPASRLENVVAVLCANLDRPAEAARTLELCSERNIPVYLYALHHPDAGVSAYLLHGVQGWKRHVARWARYRPEVYETSLWMLRVIVTLLRKQSILPIRRTSRARRRLLARATVVASAQSELDLIGLEIGVPSRSAIVPHLAAASSPEAHPFVPRRIIVAGRIEGRKNQLSAIEIAKRLPNLDFIFVGAPVASEQVYFNSFLKAVADTPNVEYLQALPKDDFFKFISSAELVLNTCFFEVTSLVDLFCVTNDIPLATTRHCYLNAQGAFARFDPASIDEGVAAVTRTLNCAREVGRAVVVDEGEGQQTILSLLREVQ